MFFVPLPFVVALVLVFLLAQMTWRQGAVVLANRRFRLLLGGYALLSMLIGLRWGYGVQTLMPLQATLAVALAAWAWCCYQSLVTATPSRWQWLHSLPTVLVVLLFVGWPQGVDAAVVLACGGYGLALLWLARRGPDALGLARLDEALLAHRALWATALPLLLSALADVFIAWDMRHHAGSHSAALVGAGQLLALLLCGYAASVAAESLPDQEPEADSPAPLAAESAESTEDEQRTMAVLHTLLQDHPLYLEPDLNLLRLARKSGIPARKVSAAINKVERKNVSQYINAWRVQQACRLLRDTDQTVSDAMLASGFQTKSNFQREFRRITGSTPLLWRQANRP
ncbi:MAG: AraC family transcriptional regulator [Rhodoferax sp.]|uniref:helix-turn-helix domain-containing protein n=2 Tax=Rhodoferax sp. TaxID=50421 RepID=UPI003267F64F